MARPCTVCEHPRREDVDRALVGGRESFRDIAGRTDLTRAALQRHRENHLSASLQRVHEARGAQGAERALSLLERLESMVERMDRFVDQAETGGSSAQFLGGMRELRATVELLGKATGELETGGTTVNVVNLATSEEWRSVQSTILRALAPHPEARQAVVRALTTPEQEPIELGSGDER